MLRLLWTILAATELAGAIALGLSFHPDPFWLPAAVAWLIATGLAVSLTRSERAVLAPCLLAVGASLGLVLSTLVGLPLIKLTVKRAVDSDVSLARQADKLADTIEQDRAQGESLASEGSLLIRFPSGKRVHYHCDGQALVRSVADSAELEGGTGDKSYLYSLSDLQVVFRDLPQGLLVEMRGQTTRWDEEPRSLRLIRFLPTRK